MIRIMADQSVIFTTFEYNCLIGRDSRSYHFVITIELLGSHR
jgi:hypothetical protein